MPEGFLGVDLGIVNIATVSTGVRHGGRRINRTRERDGKLRSKLQKKNTKSGKRRAKKRAGKAKGPAKGSRGAFVDFFHPSEGADPNEYPAGIPQVLRLMNSDWTAKTSAFISKTTPSGQSPARNIDMLFLATLSRRPTAAESQRLEAYLQGNNGNPSKAFGDILWALLNCSEFTVNH